MYVEIHPSFSLHVSATPYHVWSSRSVAAPFLLRSNLGRDTLFHRIAGLTRGAVSVGFDCVRLSYYKHGEYMEPPCSVHPIAEWCIFGIEVIAEPDNLAFSALVAGNI